MANAEEVKDWVEGIDAFESGNYEDAILKFSGMNPTAKIMFNVGCCFLCLNDHSRALQKLNHALNMDSHLVIAYFLQGEILYIEEKYSASKKSYTKAHEAMRGKPFIDYRPIGLKHIMQEWQVIANEIIVSARLHHDYSSIVHLKDQTQQSNIQDILKSVKAGRSVDLVKFLPVVLFQPPKGSAQNVNRKTYIEEAKVVSTENTDEIYSGFSGIKLMENSPPTMPLPVPVRTPPNRPMPPRPASVFTPPLTRRQGALKPSHSIHENEHVQIGSYPPRGSYIHLKPLNSPSLPVKPPRTTSHPNNNNVRPIKPRSTSNVSTPKPAVPKPPVLKKETDQNILKTNTPTAKPRHFQQNNNIMLITNKLNRELSERNGPTSLNHIQNRVEKQPSFPVPMKKPPQKPLPSKQHVKKDPPPKPPSPKMRPSPPLQKQRKIPAKLPLERSITSPSKPMRPPKPATPLQRQSQTDDEHIYETPDLHKNKSNSLTKSRSFPSELSTSHETEELKLEKTLYGNIFCEVPASTRSCPPKKPLPVLRKY